MENIQNKKDFKSYINREFDKVSGALEGKIENDLILSRWNAYNSFMNNGIPTLKSENWKYTNLTFLNKIEFNNATESDLSNSIKTSELYYNSLESHKIYLINGKYSSQLSDVIDDKQIKLEYLNVADNHFNEKYGELYGKFTNSFNHTFANINTALIDNVLVIKIENNAQLKTPIQIINISDSRENPVFYNTRILIISGKSSSAKIVETSYSFGGYQNVKNIVKEFFLEENSHLNYYKIQDDSNQSHTFDFTQAYQRKDSHFDEAAISINGKFVRNDLRSILDGENIESHYYGIFIAGNNDFVDNHTFVDHAKPNSFSNENYRGIISDNGTGVFNGKILVRRDAQKTNAYQSNKNVLLSNNATINTKPELEIYADDVKCSHGATSGALDKNSVFYLKQRGIGQKTAEKLLLKAFAIEVVNEIKIDQLREMISVRIEDKLSGL